MLLQYNPNNWKVAYWEVVLFSHSVMPGSVSLFFTVSWSWLKLMSIELMMPSNHLILCGPLLLLLLIFPASRSFLMRWLFESGGQSIGAWASTSVLPMNIQCWFPLWWTDFLWISLQSKGLSRVFSNTVVQNHQFLCSAFIMVQLSHPYKTTGKTTALTIWTLAAK